MSELEKQHQECTNRFIELANQMKDDGVDPALVSGALMMASGIYATYISAGNEGALQATGIRKVVNLYQNTLERYQEFKKNEMMKKNIG
ncbi:MAG: DUF3144 domain-containing protein [Xanthomonadales bacterium]|nr:DUF3144 domain-containing protein [Gammaproteobacteria bacterium]MBT8050422.1 DUF3144 domain-containing protein [Gammaproteobacteria bacterium]MBT8056412.1 DUF3144 domain-containing protein [Gammaproteobacteria bacterium]NNJ80154.1 DUF3144 domain-containing protein [Xanthomonadales bacterium]NNL05592.1 DUF3144 domain-containing protein [Xanthomonadales bacterium]